MDHHPPADPERIREYHAHVYYRPETREAAAALRRELEARFPAVRLGRWHDALVGPHTRSMYQIAFAPDEIAGLVHPETGDDLADHQDHAMWLGDRLALRLEALGGAD